MEIYGIVEVDSINDVDIDVEDDDIDKGVVVEDDGIDKGVVVEDDGIDKGVVVEDDGIDKGVVVEDSCFSCVNEIVSWSTVELICFLISRSIWVEFIEIISFSLILFNAFTLIVIKPDFI